MDLPDFSLQLIQGFLICLARVGAMVGSIPVFSGGQVPPQLRVGFAFLFSLLAFPVAAAPLLRRRRWLGLLALIGAGSAVAVVGGC